MRGLLLLSRVVRSGVAFRGAAWRRSAPWCLAALTAISPLAMPRPAVAGNGVGAWSELANWPLIPLHAMLIPDGRVLTYGSNATAARPASSSTISGARARDSCRGTRRRRIGRCPTRPGPTCSAAPRSSCRRAVTWPCSVATSGTGRRPPITATSSPTVFSAAAGDTMSAAPTCTRRAGTPPRPRCPTARSTFKAAKARPAPGSARIGPRSAARTAITAC